MTAGSLPAGTRLGPYEIAALIGRGGFGEVYRAHDSRLGRDVAIKTVRGALSREDVRRLEVEARATAALNHPNIVAVFDVGSEPGLAYVVTELLEGENLRAILRRGPVAPPQAMVYARQIVDALAAAHAKGIVHRDLKPENIFVLAGNNIARIKVLDFGLAKQIVADAGGALETTSVLTVAGEVMGTPEYLSPEQARAHAVDHRSDIFSFGDVLYEMLVGRPPFRRDSLADTIAAIVRDDPPALPADVTAAVPGIGRVVARCLRKDPAERFQSASDLRFALEAPASIPEPVTSVPEPVTSNPEPLDFWLTRRERKARRRRERGKENDGKPRRRSRVFIGVLVLLALRAGWSTGQRWLTPDGRSSPGSVAVLEHRLIAVSEDFVPRALAGQATLDAVFSSGRVEVVRVDATHLDVAAPSPRLSAYVSALKLGETLSAHRFADEPCVARKGACAAPLFSGSGQSKVLASIDLHGASAKGLLQWIAVTSGWPVVFDGVLKGSVDLSLTGVPWDFIVRSCLELQGLDLAATRLGDVWVISSRARAKELSAPSRS